MKTLIGVIIWIMMGLATVGIGSTFPNNKIHTVADITFFVVFAPIAFPVTAICYIITLDAWNHCVINCEKIND